jgi:glycosyltransferase involved in cell wall biosynthesis/tetratricopeptide (TPR) repeat protein
MKTPAIFKKIPDVRRAERDIIMSANEARDNKEWSEAAALYEQALNLNPSLHDIRVQLGHMLKESGRLSSASEAYHQALDHKKDDADLYLQIGHLRKLQGDLLGARSYYARANEIDPNNRDAMIELSRLNATPDDGQADESIRPSPVSLVATVPKRIDDEAAAHRTAGDSARDIRAWRNAARHYQAYLDLVPTDAGIWAQLGHSLKELGDLEGGKNAYKSGLHLTPSDADLHLHLGDTLKVQGNTSAALESYRRAFALRPLRAAAREIRDLDLRFDEFVEFKAKPRSTSLTYLEVSDLLEVIATSKTLSGIQRVQLGLISYVLDRVDGRPIDDVRIVTWADNHLWELPSDVLSKIVSLLSTSSESKTGTLKSLLAVLHANSVLVVANRGDTLIETGATWLHSDLTAQHEQLKKSGVRIGQCIYDFIPLTHPEYCHSYLTERFSRAISGALLHLDFAITISDYTQSEMKRLLAAGGYPAIPSMSVCLAQEPVLKTPSEWTPAIADIHGNKYVLCVGTLHAHKNHAAIVQVWRNLIQSGIEPPILVIAGKRGYGVDDLFNQLEATDYLDGRVRIIEGLSDGELATLYRDCNFTIFPSLVEGWGLPVGESLAYGKLCVASNTSAIPEVGGNFVIYIDPLNLRAMTEEIGRLLSNPEEVLRYEAEIARNFKPRDWPTYALAFLQAATELMACKPLPAIPLPANHILRPRQQSMTWRSQTGLPQRSAVVDFTLRSLILTKGWHPAETWGSWMAENKASIEFTSELPQGSVARVILQFRTLPWPRRNRVTVQSRCGATRSMSVPARQDYLLWIDCKVMDEGRVSLLLTLEGSLAVAQDPRPLGAGLYRLLYMAQESASDILPSAVLSRPATTTDNAGNLVVPRDVSAFQTAIRRNFMLRDGWKPVEEWGAWMDASIAEIAFYTDVPAGQAVRVAIRLRSTPDIAGASLTIEAGCGASTILQISRTDAQGQLLWLDCTVGADQYLSLKLSAAGMQGRDVAGRIGLSGLIYGRHDSLSDRLSLTEALLFPPPNQTGGADPEGQIRFTVTGHVKGSYSLAEVNRRLALAIEEVAPGTVRLEQVEGQLVSDLTQLPPADRTMIRTIATRPTHKDGSDVVISQHWPVWVPPNEGDLPLAYVFWEESQLPTAMTVTLNGGFRGVLASSRSVAKALIDSGVHIPVRVAGFAPNLDPFKAAADRRPLVRGKSISAASPFTFLHISSCFPRKGVDVLLAAYAKMFRRSDPVRLVIKGFPNPHNTVRADLQAMSANDPDMPDVDLIEDDLLPAEILKLYEAADAMVLPTRGEGFNIPAAEAMAAGLPLIVTGFGAQTDFATEKTAQLIDFHFAPSKSHLATNGSVWVDPDLTALATLMRASYDQALAIEDGSGAASSLLREQVEAARASAERLTDGAAWVNRITKVARELMFAPPPATPAVAWVSTWNVKCGIAEYSRLLLSHFGDVSQKLTILCDERTTGDNLSSVPGWPVLATWRVLDPRTIERLAQAIEDTAAPLVVIQHHPGLINWPELTTLLMDVRVNSRVTMVTMHNVRDLGACTPARMKEVVAALATVSRVLVHTVRDLNLLKEYGLVHNVALFPQGANRQDIAPRAARGLPPDSSPLIGSYGFFLPHKGFEILIRVFAIVVQSWPAARLRLVTAEYPIWTSAEELAKCRALAVALGINHLIEWHTDYLENSRSLELLNECDLIVLPYQETPESSSAAVRTAICSRAPVAVTPIDIFDDVGEAVLRLDGTSVDKIFAGVAWLLNDVGGRDAVQSRAGAWLETHDWSVLGQKMHRIGRGLVASSPDDER